MKKTYQIPVIKIVNIEPESMIAESSIDKGGSYNGSATIESRRGSSLWDEEYDEE